MEKFSLVLTNYILKKGVITKEYYDIYLYGFQSGLEILTNVICSVIIAVSLNMVIEGVLFFMFFIPLRSYGGGLHMEKHLACLISSCLILTSILLMVKYFSLDLFLSMILYVMSLLVIKLVDPVNHPNRPVDKEENLKFSKKLNICLLLCSIIALMFLMTNSNQYLLLEALVFAFVCITSVIGKIKYS